ncbi:hypothetical protein GCK72_022560 [Caenorhabditis remanei]|uniref:SAM domain-containing protein n=1 Tax=Caenorhabditis remanei TaxID=31234 RepID=A0A6A5FU18_CAERE|nr:hypothetical protein GCK72_022560 [Caenorhabditis remanei]KAF1746108.1 hypothetical protein GCK72_022560 [Caenorhabditis remanei]
MSNNNHQGLRPSAQQDDLSDRSETSDVSRQNDAAKKTNNVPDAPTFKVPVAAPNARQRSQGGSTSSALRGSAASFQGGSSASAQKGAVDAKKSRKRVSEADLLKSMDFGPKEGGTLANVELGLAGKRPRAASVVSNRGDHQRYGHQVDEEETDDEDDEEYTESASQPMKKKPSAPASTPAQRASMPPTVNVVLPRNLAGPSGCVPSTSQMSLSHPPSPFNQIHQAPNVTHPRTEHASPATPQQAVHHQAPRLQNPSTSRGPLSHPPSPFNAHMPRAPHGTRPRIGQAAHAFLQQAPPQQAPHPIPPVAQQDPVQPETDLIPPEIREMIQRDREQELIRLQVQNMSRRRARQSVQYAPPPRVHIPEPVRPTEPVYLPEPMNKNVCPAFMPPNSNPDFYQWTEEQMQSWFQLVLKERTTPEMLQKIKDENINGLCVDEFLKNKSIVFTSLNLKWGNIIALKNAATMLQNNLKRIYFNQDMAEFERKMRLYRNQ